MLERASHHIHWHFTAHLALWHGKLMEAGWSLDAQQQVMYHPQYDVQIPVDMQHRSLALKGHIRMIQEEPHVVRSSFA